MGAMAAQITSLTIVYPTVYSGADQRKHQRSASLAFVRWIHRWPVNSPHKGPVTREMFPFDDVIMFTVSVTCVATICYLLVHLPCVPPARQQGPYINRNSIPCKLIWEKSACLVVFFKQCKTSVFITGQLTAEYAVNTNRYFFWHYNPTAPARHSQSIKALTFHCLYPSLPHNWPKTWPSLYLQMPKSIGKQSADPKFRQMFRQISLAISSFEEANFAKQI